MFLSFTNNLRCSCATCSPREGERVLLCLRRAPLLSEWLAFHKLRKTKEIVGSRCPNRTLWIVEPGGCRAEQLEARHYKLYWLRPSPSFLSEMFCISEGAIHPGDFSIFLLWTLKAHFGMPRVTALLILHLLISGFQMLPSVFKCPPSPSAGATLADCSLAPPCWVLNETDLLKASHLGENHHDYLLTPKPSEFPK